jgi:hypothetical protein
VPQKIQKKIKSIFLNNKTNGEKELRVSDKFVKEKDCVLAEEKWFDASILVDSKAISCSAQPGQTVNIQLQGRKPFCRCLLQASNRAKGGTSLLFNFLNLLCFRK